MCLRGDCISSFAISFLSVLSFSPFKTHPSIFPELQLTAYSRFFWHFHRFNVPFLLVPCSLLILQTLHIYYICWFELSDGWHSPSFHPKPFRYCYLPVCRADKMWKGNSPYLFAFPLKIGVFTWRCIPFISHFPATKTDSIILLNVVCSVFSLQRGQWTPGFFVKTFLVLILLLLLVRYRSVHKIKILHNIYSDDGFSYPSLNYFTFA